MWLPWDYAAVLAALCGLGAAVSYRRDRRTLFLVTREGSIVAALYTLWQLAGRLSVVHLEGAYSRARWLWDFERAIYLPNEAAWQAWLLPHEFWVQAANIYYGGAHVPGMGIFLVWMFVRHRDLYARWRNRLAALTAACLVIQLLPLAPPRFLDELGIVDTGVKYGQSVYASFGNTVAGQLQAMPSLHVGWAVLIAIAAWTATPHWGRWVAVAHAVLTSYVVVVTGNHYWLDGAVAAVLLLLIIPIESAIRTRLMRRAPDVIDPALVERVATP